MAKISQPLRRVLIGAAIAAATLALLYPLAVRHHYEVDIHSGRERDAVAYWELPIHWTTRETGLSQTLTSAGHVFKEPEWHRYHTRGSGARINYRYGALHHSVQGLMSLMESINVPAPDRIRLAELALHCLETELRFNVLIDQDSRRLSVVDDDGKEIGFFQPQAE